MAAESLRKMSIENDTGFDRILGGNPYDERITAAIEDVRKAANEKYISEVQKLNSWSSGLSSEAKEVVYNDVIELFKKINIDDLNSLPELANNLEKLNAKFEADGIPYPHDMKNIDDYPQYRAELINLLLENPTMKEHFGDLLEKAKAGTAFDPAMSEALTIELEMMKNSAPLASGSAGSLSNWSGGLSPQAKEVVYNDVIEVFRKINLEGDPNTPPIPELVEKFEKLNAKFHSNGAPYPADIKDINKYPEYREQLIKLLMETPKMSEYFNDSSAKVRGDKKLNPPSAVVVSGEDISKPESAIDPVILTIEQKRALIRAKRRQKKLEIEMRKLPLHERLLIEPDKLRIEMLQRVGSVATASIEVARAYREKEFTKDVLESAIAEAQKKGVSLEMNNGKYTREFEEILKRQEAILAKKYVEPAISHTYAPLAKTDSAAGLTAPSKASLRDADPSHNYGTQAVHGLAMIGGGVNTVAANCAKEATGLITNIAKMLNTAAGGDQLHLLVKFANIVAKLVNLPLKFTGKAFDWIEKETATPTQVKKMEATKAVPEAKQKVEKAVSKGNEAAVSAAEERERTTQMTDPEESRRPFDQVPTHL